MKLLPRSLVLVLVLGLLVGCRPALSRHNDFPQQNPDTRWEIVYSHNDGSRSDDTIWSMNPDGSDKKEILSRSGYSLIEAKISDDGKFLAAIECGSWVASYCEFVVYTYPDLKTTVASGHAIPFGGLSWKRYENTLYTLDWYTGDLQATVVSSTTPSTTAIVKDAPYGRRPIVDESGFFAIENDSGVVVEGTLIPNMRYPTISAADSVVAGTCGGFYCEFESIKSNVPASVSKIEMEEPIMAFATDTLTSVVYVNAGDVYLREYTSGKTICLTCEG